MPLVRPDPSPAAESSSLSTNSDPLLREVDDYIPDHRDNEDSVDRLVEGEPDEEPSTSSAPYDSLVSGVISNYSGRHLGVPVALVGANEERLSFTADFMEPKTRQRDIVLSYK